MGGKWSKERGGDAPVTPHLADLSSYEAACRADPALETFDRILQQRTYQAINTIAAVADSRSVSFDAFRVLTNSQVELNHEVVKMILDCQRESWDKSLFRLVEDYFKTSEQTLKFLNVLESCLARARNSQLILQLAVQRFEEENKAVEEEGEEKYAKTLKELQSFKDAGTPFTDDFFSILGLVSREQIQLLKNLQAQKEKVDKKLKSARTWTRVSNVLFVAAFVSALVFSVVAAAISAPPVVIALATALTVPIGSVGKWCNSLWKNYGKELGRQSVMLGMTSRNTLVTVNEVEQIRLLVDKFQVKLEAILQNADFALAEDDVAVGLVMDEIKGSLEGFMGAILDLRGRIDKCSQEIRMVRTVISQRIIANSS